MVSWAADAYIASGRNHPRLSVDGGLDHIGELGETDVEVHEAASCCSAALCFVLMAISVINLVVVEAPRRLATAGYAVGVTTRNPSRQLRGRRHGR